MEKGVPIRSVSRSIAVLQIINRYGSLSMMEIARQSTMPYPTAYRIVQTLMHEGLVEQEPSRKNYRPTALVHSLAHGYQPGSRLVSVSRPLIHDLTKAVGWPVSITVRVGTNMVVRDSTHAETSLTFENYYPGFTLPILDCASGRVCLAHMSSEEREDVRRWMGQLDNTDPRINQFYTPELLAKIRSEGYAAQGWGRHNLTPGKTSSIAVPIMRGGHFEAALTLIYFAASMKQPDAIARYVETMTATAAKIGVGMADA
ncbi:helix-turn-helix domain-containing protein [Sphingobium boeckii]|uniref:IclR family mhp operon transcriptional activator n=1 Tax=Sphingobium boeckii TaxID=1082345 RepID=A0A7W9EH34_9SPHN|nr:helix-turn-helix domain-containing protein [Sphingobium boeckii]MBB5687725.1 IclR family mhp operon transcriptional activator [Sphingobium boeckii]